MYLHDEHLVFNIESLPKWRTNKNSANEFDCINILILIYKTKQDKTIECVRHPKLSWKANEYTHKNHIYVVFAIKNCKRERFYCCSSVKNPEYQLCDNSPLQKKKIIVTIKITMIKFSESKWKIEESTQVDFCLIPSLSFVITFYLLSVTQF